MKTRSSLILVFGSLLVLGGLFAADAGAINICEKATSVCGGPTCIGPFTSLPITSGVLECHGIGWRPDGGPCGTKRCYLIFQCACGNQLSRGTFCDGGNQPGCDDCDPEPWLNGEEPLEAGYDSVKAGPETGQEGR